MVRLDEVTAEQGHVMTVTLTLTLSLLLTAPADSGPAVDGGPGVPHQQDNLVGQLSPQHLLRVSQSKSDDLQIQHGEQEAELGQKPRRPAVQGATPPPEFGVSWESDIVPLFMVQVATHIIKITTQD